MKHTQKSFVSFSKRWTRKIQLRQGGKHKNLMEMFSFSKMRNYIDSAAEIQFKRMHMDDAHTRWRQEFKGTTFLLSKIFGFFDMFFIFLGNNRSLNVKTLGKNLTHLLKSWVCEQLQVNTRANRSHNHTQCCSFSLRSAFKRIISVIYYFGGIDNLAALCTTSFQLIIGFSARNKENTLCSEFQVIQWGYQKDRVIWIKNKLHYSHCYKAWF